MFHGPREDVVEFFESCGFCCPERKGVPDFLQEVTSKNDQKVSLLMPSPQPGTMYPGHIVKLTASVRLFHCMSHYINMHFAFIQGMRLGHIDI